MDNKGRQGTVVRGMRSTVGRESTTFGLSILATAMFGLLQVVQGSLDTARIFLSTAGAVLSFTLLEGALSRRGSASRCRRITGRCWLWAPA